MFSMPPATTTSASPARISAAASMIALSPEPHTRLIVVALALSPRPALRAAWRAGAWPTPACSTWPMSTSSICVPAGTPARSTAALMAMPPSVVAGTSARVPSNLPIGVRAAETMKTWPLAPLKPFTDSIVHDEQCYDAVRGARTLSSVADGAVAPTCCAPSSSRRSRCRRSPTTSSRSRAPSRAADFECAHVSAHAIIVDASGPISILSPSTVY